MLNFCDALLLYNTAVICEYLEPSTHLSPPESTSGLTWEKHEHIFLLFEWDNAIDMCGLRPFIVCNLDTKVVLGI